MCTSAHRRLQRASNQVCGVSRLNIAGSLTRIADTRRYYKEALSAAVEKIDNQLVTKMHNGKLDLTGISYK